MALVLVLSADLMFSSRLQAQLQAAGHELEIVGDTERLGVRLAAGERAPEALLADLTDESLGAAVAVEELREQGALAGARTLAYYSHVDVASRDRAREAGFDLVVPRSRIAREAPQLLEGLIGA